MPPAAESVPVLVVDDNSVARGEMCTALAASTLGATCDGAADLASALAIAKTKTYDCILIAHDTAKPPIEIVREFRAAGVQAPIVMVTSRAEAEYEELAADGGIIDFVPKADVTTPRLLRRIRFAIRTGRAEAAIAQSLVAAQLAASARDDVLAVVSHDLRGPLHAISLACEALREDVKPESARYLGAIERASARAERLISDLLEASAIENGALTLAIYPTDAASVVRQAATEAELLARETSTTITVRVPDDPIVVAADRDRVLQVLANLIGNALKHARDTPITLGLERRDREAVITVSDRGPGIVAADLPFVFERYRRGRTKKVGAGLGLAIAKGIVVAHGGTLEVASVAGEGATFSFTLPMASRSSVAALRPPTST